METDVSTNTAAAIAAAAAAASASEKAAVSAALVGKDISYIQKDISLIKSSINELATNTTARIIALEQRLDKNDIYHASIDIEYFRKIADWGYNLRAKMAVFIFIGSILIIILNALVISVLQKWLGIS